MRLFVGKQEYTLEFHDNVTVTILEIINQEIAEKDLILCGFYIDGEEYYGDLFELMMNQGESIQTVKAIVITEKELKQDSILSIQEYIGKALPVLSQLFNEFYSTPSQNTWENLGQLVEGLEWIGKAVEFIDSAELYDFKKEVEDIAIAVSQKDTGLIGDLIQYEIIPRFEEIRNVFGADSGGKSLDFN
ncbi:hypothetical protein J31TS6_33700 [Brevibacillus reuszeri]|uniref:hypothetical protein n=1 Tax=Brevibacillus reuszeri TaxID=54915 RepID=UPI001B2E449F|nr:hypothetical protein [Brevibacillus reuszeri]GIO07342.1 hypothetical protein J31TS6_33700 [Brevibacillus reuszeri]